MGSICTNGFEGGRECWVPLVMTATRIQHTLMRGSQALAHNTGGRRTSYQNTYIHNNMIFFGGWNNVELVLEVCNDMAEVEEIFVSLGFGASEGAYAARRV